MEKLKIVYKSVDDLIPYINNPRINDHAVDAVASSIKNFGFRVPVIIDKGNEIVAGHTRIKAAKKLGMKEVPVIVASDLDENQIKAFRLADNKVGELAHWDYESLDIELMAIKNIDLEEMGLIASNLGNIDFDQFFEDAHTKDNQPKTATCPNCGEVFEL